MGEYAGTLNDVARAVLPEYEGFTSTDPVGQQELADMVSGMRLWFGDQTRGFTSTASTCVDRFIDGELDHDTPGDRGPGRSSTYWPRLAARHRRILRSFDSEQRVSLGGLIKQHIHCGYLFAELIHDLDRIPPEIDAKRLYENMWMQTMYSPPFEVRKTEPNDVGLEGIWFSATGAPLRESLETVGVVWEHKDTEIVTAYFVGGMILRVIEALPPEQRDRINALSGSAYAMAKAEQLRGPASSRQGCLSIAMAFAVCIGSFILFQLR